MALVRALFWLVLFAVCTFGFAVLFEHGPKDYAKNAQTDWVKLRAEAEQVWQKKGF